MLNRRFTVAIGLVLTALVIALGCWLVQHSLNLQTSMRQAWSAQLQQAWQTEKTAKIHQLQRAFTPHSANDASAGSWWIHSEAAAPPLQIVPEDTLWNATTNKLALQGLHATGPHNFMWIVRSTRGQQSSIVGLPVEPSLRQLAASLGGQLHIRPLWQSVSDQACSALALPWSDNPLCVPRIPVVDIHQRVVAHLSWDSPQYQKLIEQHSHWLAVQLASLAAGWLIVLVVLYAMLRHMLRPISDNIHKLYQLAAMEINVPLDELGLDATGEVGLMAHSLHGVRDGLRQLDALQQERQRLRIQHERLIRTELRNLAESLDAASREEILRTLEQASSHTAASSQQDADSTAHGLAELAGVLGRMSGLVSTQQNRLLHLLKELQASMHKQALLASLQQELEIARQMQLSILPREAPQTPSVHMEATMIPAKEVGGDFYDYFLIDPDHLAVVVADVSGKGVPAAFFMAISRTLLKSHAMHLRAPGTTISTLNDQLCAENEQMMFVTIFYAVLQLSTGRLRYVNAGHNPPILCTREGYHLVPSHKNMALAVLEDQDYAESELHMQPGDRLVLYTDGVTEATDPEQHLFGDERLLSTVREHQPSAPITDTLLNAVRTFERGAPQADDITIVSVRYTGASPK